MGYILVIFLLIVVPLLIVVLLTRRPTGIGGGDSSGHGVTPLEPAADEPTPGAGTTNEIKPGAEKRVPPA